MEAMNRQLWAETIRREATEALAHLQEQRKERTVRAGKTERMLRGILDDIAKDSKRNPVVMTHTMKYAQQLSSRFRLLLRGLGVVYEPITQTKIRVGANTVEFYGVEFAAKSLRGRNDWKPYFDNSVQEHPGSNLFSKCDEISRLYGRSRRIFN